MLNDILKGGKTATHGVGRVRRHDPVERDLRAHQEHKESHTGPEHLFPELDLSYKPSNWEVIGGYWSVGCEAAGVEPTFLSGAATSGITEMKGRRKFNTRTAIPARKR